MELAVAVASPDFNFDSECSTPYLSAPTSPKRFGEFYYSAPTSPTRASAMYREFNNLSFINGSGNRRGVSSSSSSSVIPFDWEEEPGKPKSKITNNDRDDDDDFEFDFSGQFEKASLTADELFDGGKIRPLKPPPGLKLGVGFGDEFGNVKSPISSPRSPRSPVAQGKKMIRDAFSPRRRKDVDPFAAAIEQTRKGSEQQRGRQRVYDPSSSNSERRGTRSLSPLRVSEFALAEQQKQKQKQQQQQQHQQQQNVKSTSSNSKSPSSSSAASSYFKGYRKWSLKDFFLFRSASEGRAADKDPLRKFALLSKKNDDVKNASFRSTDSSGSRRRGPISAHELHYTANRAVSEDMRKKTFLPYKQGLFGCMGFNPAVQAFGRRFDF